MMINTQTKSNQMVVNFPHMTKHSIMKTKNDHNRVGTIKTVKNTYNRRWTAIRFKTI